MAELLLLIICAAFIVLLFTTFIGTLTLPFLNTSKKDVQDLFLAAKDLTQPMGSFPSTLLYPPAPIVGKHRSDSTALPLSPEQMSAEGGSQSNATRGVAEPTRGESELKPTTTRHPNGLPPIRAGFNTITSPTPTKPVPDNHMSSGSEDSAEEHFFDSLEYRQASDDDTQLAGLIAEVQLPEQPGAETDSVGSIPTVADNDEEEQQERASTAAVEEALNKAQVFEKAIQGLVDPEGGDDPDHQRMIELVTGIVEGQAEAVEKLRSETVRFHRAEDDLRHGWQDMKEVFERIVRGQNVRLRSTQEENDEILKENDEIVKENDEIVKENDELVKENETFIKENAALKEDFDSMKIQQENDLRTLEIEKQAAQEDADTLKAEVEGRIDAIKDRYEKEKSAAKDKNWQEQNALICARKMVADNLFEARRQVTQGQQQHQATVKTKDNTIKELEMMISRLRTTAMASTELVASAERVADKQLNDQRNESSALRDQLRESKNEIKTLVEWKEKAEFAERKYQRLSDLRKDEKTTLKADHAHVVARLELDRKGLDRTITINEGVIAELERRITGMESGQEFKDIKSKLLRVQKQNQKSTSDVKTLKEQLQALELETGVQKRNIEKKDLEIQQNTQAWATEKTTLEDQLKQDKDALGHEMQEQVGRLKNEKEGLLRNVAAAQSAEQGVLAQVQTLEKEKAQTAEQHQRTLSAKDQRIQELEREIGEKAQTAEQHQRTLSAKDQRIQELEREIGEKNAAGSAIEEQKNIMEAALNRERGTHEEATNRAKETETTLQTEISALRSQAEAYTNAPEPMSTTATDSERADNRKELTFLATEVNEAFYLSEEIGEHGLVRDSGECALLKDLNSAKKAQAFLEFDVKQPDVEKNELLFTIAEAMIDEGRFSQCDSTKRPELVKQARAANERMQRIQKMLSTNLDVQKDAVLEILRSPAKNETNNRQEEGESNMADISEMQNTIIPEASETGQPSRTIADILATLQNLGPATPRQASQQVQPLQQENVGNFLGFESPGQPEGVSQPPLPGLFQAPSITQAPVPRSLVGQGATRRRRPVISQPPGELKMPRGLTASMRQFAKGFVRTGDAERAEKLLLEKFKQLQICTVQGLKTYLEALKKQVEAQPLDQMEQPGGWTDAMTESVENSFNDGKSPEAIVAIIKTAESYTPLMEGIELYVQKLKQEHDKPAPEPAGWATDMTETVIEQLELDIDTPLEQHERLLKIFNDFDAEDRKGLERYILWLKRELKAQREEQMPRD